MLNGNTTRLSVIIVNYNTLDEIKDCINSLFRYNDINETLEVIVVEQSSDDRYFRILTTQFPQIKIYRAPNRGFGAGNNFGASRSHGDYLLFLNPDTVLTEPVFRFACDEFDGDSKLGLFGVRLLDSEGHKNQSFYFRNTVGLFRGYIWRIFDASSIFLPRMMYVTGADMFVRKEAFLRAGEFDERLFMYYEEPDLCRRLIGCGYRIRFYSQKKIIHLEGRSAPNQQMFSCRLKSFITLAEKNGQSPRRLLRRWERCVSIKQLIWPNSRELAMQSFMLKQQLRCLDVAEH